MPCLDWNNWIYFNKMISELNLHKFFMSFFFLLWWKKLNWIKGVPQARQREKETLSLLFELKTILSVWDSIYESKRGRWYSIKSDNQDFRIKEPKIGFDSIASENKKNYSVCAAGRCQYVSWGEFKEKERFFYSSRKRSN